MDILDFIRGLPSGFLFLIIFLIILAASSIKIVKESERVLIYRLGRFIGIKGPGLFLIIPGIDKAIRINLNELNEKVPGWQGLPIEELNEKLNIAFEDFFKKGE